MKIIKITESQYKRLVRNKNLNEQVIYNNEEDEYDVTPDIGFYIDWLNDTLESLHNLSLYIDKIENGIVYIDWGKYSEEEKNLIKKYNKEWVVSTTNTKDSISGDGYYFSGLDWDFEDTPEFVYDPSDWSEEVAQYIEINEPDYEFLDLDPTIDWEMSPTIDWDELNIITIDGNSNYIIGKQVNIDKNGPHNHGSRTDRKRTDWQSGNATDIFSKPGTTVYSITKGKVLKIGGNENQRTGSVFGVQITVKGEDGYPDVFYTHLQKARVKKGDSVTLGTPLAEIIPWYDKEGNLKSSHVHVGVPWGEKLDDLIDLNTGKIKS